MQSDGGSVVQQPMIPTDHAELHNVLIVIKLVQPLQANSGRHAGHNQDLTHTANPAMAGQYVAALYELLVTLWVIKSPDQGPHQRQWRVYDRNLVRPTLVR